MFQYLNMNKCELYTIKDRVLTTINNIADKIVYVDITMFNNYKGWCYHMYCYCDYTKSFWKYVMGYYCIFSNFTKIWTLDPWIEAHILRKRTMACFSCLKLKITYISPRFVVLYLQNGCQNRENIIKDYIYMIFFLSFHFSMYVFSCFSSKAICICLPPAC